MAEQRLTFRFDGDASGFQNAIKKTEGSLTRIQGKLSGLGSSLRNVGSMMTLGITAPLSLLGKSFVDAASDAEETASKFTAVFKNLSADAEDFVQATAGELGRSTTDLRKYMATFQDTFVPLGFARDEGLEMSKALTLLTSDLASFNNKAEPEVLAALQSAIVGNHETMRQFGVIINQAMLDQELLNMGLEGGALAATEAQKAQARLNIIVAGTADAQGDAARTAGSFENQMRRLGGQFTDFSEQVGNILIPVIKKIVKFFGDVIQKFKDLDGNSKILVVAIAGIAVAFGPVLTVLGMIISPIGLIITAFVALAKTVHDNSEVVLENLVAIINNFIDIYNNSLRVRMVVQGLLFVFKAVFKGIKTAIMSVVEVFKGFGKLVLAVLKGDFASISGIVKDAFSNISDDVADTGAEIGKDFANAVEESLTGNLEYVTAESIKNGISNGLDSIKSFIIEKAKAFGFEIPQSISDAIKDASSLVKDAAGNDGAGGEISKALQKARASFAEKGKALIQDAVSEMFVGIGEAIGAGGNILKMFIGMLADFMGQLGKMMIQFGVAQLAFIKALKSLSEKSAGLLIVAGVALVALSSAIKGAMSKGASGGGLKVPAMAEGGIVTGPTLALIGEAGPEAVVPLDRLGGMGANKGEFVLRGQDLILAMERAGKFKNRILS